MPPSHVLVPLDGSPLADAALEEALERFTCRVTVLSVVTPVDATMSEGGILGADDDRRENARDRADRVVGRARTRASAGGDRSGVARRVLGTVATTVVGEAPVTVTVVR